MNTRRTVVRSRSSPATLWVLEIKLRSPGLVAVATSLALILRIDGASREQDQPRSDMLWALRVLHVTLATLHRAELSKGLRAK